MKSICNNFYIYILHRHHWTAVILYNTTYISQKYISFLKELSKDIPLNCLKSVEEAEKYILENPTKASKVKSML